MAQLPFIEHLDLLIEPWRGGFAETQRPLPDTIRYVTHFKPNYYDFAILHLDQQCIYDPSKGDRISKGRLYAEVREYIKKVDPKLPIFVINHMTPFHDKYTTNYTVNYIKDMVGDSVMISNSYEARRQWGFGEVITHGLEPDEWGFDVERFQKTGEKIDAPKEPRCVVVLSPAGMEKAYRRIFLRQVVRYLDEWKVPFDWVGVSKKFDSFDEYRDYLARSLVFFNPTWQSPRPRARTEAMLSGCCVITTPYHDADSFIVSPEIQYKDNKMEMIIDDKTNGVLTSKVPLKDPRIMDNPEVTAQMIKYLVYERPDLAMQIGKQGREYAKDNFNKTVFDNQWINILKKYKIL